MATARGKMTKPPVKLLTVLEAIDKASRANLKEYLLILSRFHENPLDPNDARRTQTAVALADALDEPDSTQVSAIEFLRRNAEFIASSGGF
jgi:hypothetical protein